MTSVSAGHIILTPTQPVGRRNGTHDLLTRSRALLRPPRRTRTRRTRTTKEEGGRKDIKEREKGGGVMVTRMMMI